MRINFFKFGSNEGEIKEEINCILMKISSFPEIGLGRSIASSLNALKLIRDQHEKIYQNFSFDGSQKCDFARAAFQYVKESHNVKERDFFIFYIKENPGRSLSSIFFKYFFASHPKNDDKFDIVRALFYYPYYSVATLLDKKVCGEDKLNNVNFKLPDFTKLNIDLEKLYLGGNLVSKEGDSFCYIEIIESLIFFRKIEILETLNCFPKDEIEKIALSFFKIVYDAIESLESAPELLECNDKAPLEYIKTTDGYVFCSFSENPFGRTYLFLEEDLEGVDQGKNIKGKALIKKHIKYLESLEETFLEKLKEEKKAAISNSKLIKGALMRRMDVFLGNFLYFFCKRIKHEDTLFFRQRSWELWDKMSSAYEALVATQTEEKQEILDFEKAKREQFLEFFFREMGFWLEIPIKFSYGRSFVMFLASEVYFFLRHLEFALENIELIDSHDPFYLKALELKKGVVAVIGGNLLANISQKQKNAQRKIDSTDPAVCNLLKADEELYREQEEKIRLIEDKMEKCFKKEMKKCFENEMKKCYKDPFYIDFANIKQHYIRTTSPPPTDPISPRRQLGLFAPDDSGYDQSKVNTVFTPA